jgi:hypothetical protein
MSIEGDSIPKVKIIELLHILALCYINYKLDNVKQLGELFIYDYLFNNIKWFVVLGQPSVAQAQPAAAPFAAVATAVESKLRTSHGLHM